MWEFIVTDEDLETMLTTVMEHLDERQRRIVAGSVARSVGRGGIAAVAEATGMSRSTVQKAVAEIDAGVEVSARVRAPGSGRRKAVDAQPGLLVALDDLIDPGSRGEPTCPLRWTTKSTRALAGELRSQGFAISHVTVAELLRQTGYSLQAPARENEGAQHPDRDRQFRHLEVEVKARLKAGEPVVSVETTKKEVVGNLPDDGGKWQPAGYPARIEAHDFPDALAAKAAPFGVDAVGANEGYVVVGDDGDTVEFAVASIRRWWFEIGRLAYADAGRFLIATDAGGSNGYRTRLWKVELAKLAAEAGVEISVSHLPRGTSKWNKIEHRVFSAISMKWRGRPLATHEVTVELIANTTSRAGRKVRARLDQSYYPTGVNATDAELAAVPLSMDTFHGEWNYTIRPPTPTHETSRLRRRRDRGDE